MRLYNVKSVSLLQVIRPKNQKYFMGLLQKYFRSVELCFSGIKIQLAPCQSNFYDFVDIPTVFNINRQSIHLFYNFYSPF